MAAGPQDGPGRVAFLFGGARSQQDDWRCVAALDALARAMPDPDPLTALAEDSPALWRAIGPGLARLDRGNDLERRVLDTDLPPAPRARVESGLCNLRTGRVAPAGDVTSAGRWLLQWQVLNIALPRLCDPEALDWIAQHGSPVFDRMLTRVRPALPEGTLPLPLELTALALPVALPSPGMDTPLCRHELDRVTAGVRDSRDRLRTVRAALRRGHLLNLPSAEDCLDGLARTCGLTLPRLGGASLARGAAAVALELGAFGGATPLCYYLWQEARVFADGRRLGPLGSHLLGQCLSGLIRHDPDSHLASRWEPGVPVTGAALSLGA